MKDITGQSVPQVTFITRKDNDWKKITTDEIFKNQQVVVFALPGAFTPTCSSTHLPGYESMAAMFKAQGVDRIICITVNDGFVADSWAKDQNAKHVEIIADGNGEFSEKMGALVDKSDIGFGKRSWRYSMYVSNGEIKKMFIEPQEAGDPFKVSDSKTMLNYLAPNREHTFATIFTRPGCPFCDKAKVLLTKNSIPFEEIEVNKHITVAGLVAASGGHTVPQVFIDGQKIGGSDDLEDFLS